MVTDSSPISLRYPRVYNYSSLVVVCYYILLLDLAMTSPGKKAIA